MLTVDNIYWVYHIGIALTGGLIGGGCVYLWLKIFCK